jgi:tRNA modification GTPase
LYEGWRAQALKSLALVEAAIDFSDEGDVSDKAVVQAEQVAAALAASLHSHLDDGHRGEILRDGFKVVLAGPPNAGKSSLLNALARRDVAIVSQMPGTTRDVIDVRLNLGGLPIVVSDTAGVRETSDGVEQEGIRRTLARARTADLVLWLEDSSSPRSGPGARLPADLGALAAPVVRVGTKSDLIEPSIALGTVRGSDVLSLSAKTGAGLPELIDRIRREANRCVGTSAASALNPAITQVRHRVHATGCHDALVAFLSSQALGLELRAEWLRLAANALGRLTGRIDADQVLGEIFGRFCIGK